MKTPSQQQETRVKLQDPLSVFEPNGFARSDASFQERRSAETRCLILEAAIKCLAEQGYARTSTSLVASEAGASRGAMLHHYPTKQALIEATIEYAFYKRMKNFISSVEALTEEERVRQNRGLYTELNNFQTPEYRAYLELNIASRSDPELRAIFLPRARKYDQVWRQQILQAFPEWQGKGEVFDRACELTRSLIEGLLINQDIWDNPEAEDTLLQILNRTLQMMRLDQFDMPPSAKPARQTAGKRPRKS